MKKKLLAIIFQMENKRGETRYRDGGNLSFVCTGMDIFKSSTNIDRIKWGCKP